MLTFTPTRVQIAELHANQATCFASLLGERIFFGDDHVVQAVRGDLRITAATYYTTAGDLSRIVRSDVGDVYFAPRNRVVKEEVLVRVKFRAVLHAEWSLGRFRVVGFRRGAWEEDLWARHPTVPDGPDSARGIPTLTKVTADRSQS